MNSNVSIISGGLLGGEREIVVDDYSSPSLIYGVCDGCGNLKNKMDDVDKENINVVKNFYSLS